MIPHAIAQSLQIAQPAMLLEDVIAKKILRFLSYLDSVLPSMPCNLHVNDNLSILLRLAFLWFVSLPLFVRKVYFNTCCYLYKVVLWQRFEKICA